MSLWKRFICFILILSSINGHAQTVDTQDSHYDSYTDGNKEVVTYSDGDGRSESESDPFYNFDHGANASTPSGGGGLSDADIVRLDNFTDGGGAGGGHGGGGGFSDGPGAGGGFADGAGAGNGNGGGHGQGNNGGANDVSPGGYGGNYAGEGNGNHGNQNNSEKSEEQKYNEFVAQVQSDIVNDTLQFESNLSGVLKDMDKNFNANPVFVDGQTYAKDPNVAYSAIENTGFQDVNTNHLSNAVTLEKVAYTSDQKEKLNSVRQGLLVKTNPSPQQAKAKVAGLQSLFYSDLAYAAGEKDKGDVYFQFAKQLVNIVTDFIPATSIAKDVYGLVIGKDLLTGEKLNTTDRALRGMFAAVQLAGAFYTGGLATPFLAAAIKEVGVIGKANANALKLTEELAKISNVVSHRTVVSLPGAAKEVTLIGRNMEQVNKMRNALNERGIVVNIFDETKYSKEAKIAFDEAKEIYSKIGDGWIPDKAIVQTSLFAENKVWIEKAVEKGHTILDAGNVTGSRVSPFYEMEKQVIETVKNVR